MQGDVPEVRVVDGRVVTAPGIGPVAMVWLPRDGQVIAKIPAMTDDRRWLHQIVGIRSPHLASRFMCTGCMSARARVWDHCHTHEFVRAPLCNPCNTRHWSGWQPQHGRAPRSRNIDTSYYRWCPFYGEEQLGKCSA